MQSHGETAIFLDLHVYIYIYIYIYLYIFVAYQRDKSKAPLLQYICYCTVATYSYIHSIHSHAIGRSHNSLLNTAQLHINVYVTRYCTLAYKMCMLQILHTCTYTPYKICMFQLLPGCNIACMRPYMMTECKIKETRYSITSRIQRNRIRCRYMAFIP